MARRILQFVGGLAIAGGAIGMKFYNKSSDHDDIKANLTKECGDDKECLSAVEQHFDSCFESHYDLGGRRRSGGLKAEEFLQCFNEKAGAMVFSYEEEGEKTSDASADQTAGKSH
jgi:hypothetical protein